MAALDKQTFDVWRESHDRNVAEILLHIRTQHNINLEYEGRISTLAAKQDECAQTISRRATWLSAVVSAIVGALVAAGLAAANSRLP